MLEQEKAYKELVIRRDIVKFIQDLRVYNYITSSKRPSEFIKQESYESYIEERGNLSGRLKRFIELADEGLVNFAAVDAYDDDLHKRINELIIKYPSKEDYDKIHSLEKDIDYMTFSCPYVEILPLELLKMNARHFLDCIIPSEELDNILVEILKRTPFVKGSLIYEFLMEHLQYSSFFIAYFQGKMPKEEVQAIFKKICKRFLNLIIDGYSKGNYFQEILELFSEEGAIVDDSIVDSILGNVNLVFADSPIPLATISRMIHESKIKMELDYKDYLASNLSKLSDMNQIEGEFPKITEVLIQLCYSDDFLSTLANLVATHKDNLEIASLLSKTFYSRYLKSVIGRKFDTYYLEAMDRLDVGRSLVMTLKAVKDVKEKNQN